MLRLKSSNPNLKSQMCFFLNYSEINPPYLFSCYYMSTKTLIVTSTTSLLDGLVLLLCCYNETRHSFDFLSFLGGVGSGWCGGVGVPHHKSPSLPIIRALGSEWLASGQ